MKRTFRDILIQEKLDYYRSVLETSMLLEDIDFKGGEQRVFTNDRGQYVSVGKHIEGEDDRRGLRGWWKNYTDTNFTSFVTPILNILHNLYGKWLEAKGNKEKLKNINASTITFQPRERFLFSDKEENKMMLVSLRPTEEGRYNTSIHINTIFDKEKMNKEKIHIYDIDDNHKRIIHNWKYIGECVVNDESVHIFES